MATSSTSSPTIYLVNAMPLSINPYYSSFVVPAKTTYYTSWSLEYQAIHEFDQPRQFSPPFLFMVKHSYLLNLPRSFGVLPPPYIAQATKRSIFDLPAELRLIIYRKSGLLPDRQFRPVRYPIQDSAFWKPGKLLALNKTFYDEVAPLPYGSRQFYLTDGMSAMSFLNTIGPQNAASIHFFHVRTLGLTTSETRIFQIPHQQSLGFLLGAIASRCPNLACFKVNSILLQRVSRTNGPPILPIRLENIKSIVDTFPQLANVTYRKSSLQLCLAAPGVEDSAMVRVVHTERSADDTMVNMSSRMVPRAWEYKTLDVDRIIARRDVWLEYRRRAMEMVERAGEAQIAERKARQTAERAEARAEEMEARRERQEAARAANTGTGILERRLRLTTARAAREGRGGGEGGGRGEAEA
jgi:hypothetical protein